MNRKLVSAVVAIGISLLCAGVHGTTLEVKLKYWMPKLEGSVRADGGGVRGTTIDVEEVLGLETEEANVFPIEVVLNLGEHFRLWFNYRDMEFEGSSSVEDEFVFSGDTFFVDLDIDSRLEMTATEVGVGFDLIPQETLALGICVSGTYFNGQATITDVDSMISAEGDLSTVVPVIGAFGEISVADGKLKLFGKISGLTYEEDTYMDLLLEAKYEILANVGIIGGYRSITIDSEAHEVFVDAELSGFFIGGAISF